MSGYEVAKSLLKKGVQIIPLDHNKKPLVSFKNIEVDDFFLEKYRMIYEDVSVLGVLTRGLWCIDIDKDHIDGVNGFDSLSNLPYTEELRFNYKHTLVQTTASGGKHIIFKKRDGINYSQKINYLPSVDIKAHPNNYFVLAGSETSKGKYKHNNIKVSHYKGDFEKRIFSKRGSYQKQIEDKYSVQTVLPNYDYSHLNHNGKGGLGKEAYKRIVNGESVMRNDDLYKAATYAKQCNVDIEPLRVLIGDNKNGDVFTEDAWERTVESASR